MKYSKNMQNSFRERMVLFEHENFQLPLEGTDYNKIIRGESPLNQHPKSPDEAASQNKLNNRNEADGTKQRLHELKQKIGGGGNSKGEKSLSSPSQENQTVVDDQKDDPDYEAELPHTIKNDFERLKLNMAPIKNITAAEVKQIIQDHGLFPQLTEGTVVNIPKNRDNFYELRPGVDEGLIDGLSCLIAANVSSSVVNNIRKFLTNNNCNYSGSPVRFRASGYEKRGWGGLPWKVRVNAWKRL